MSGLKPKLLLMLLLTALLCGCSRHTLASREIVRAVCFSAENEVCLILEGTDENGYRIIQGQGDTMAQALDAAQRELIGQAYYGLMDVAVFPTTVDFRQARELGKLLYEKAQPAPESAVFAADWNGDTAAELYDRLRQMQEPHCGLERLFEQEDCCFIPLWRQESFGYLFLQKERNECVTRPEAAGLLAVLCGQSSQVDMTFANQTAHIMADARVSVEPTAQGTLVTVTLRDVKLSTLTPALDEQSAQQRLANSWQQAFSRYAAMPADPFRLDFFASCRFGAHQTAAAPKLSITFE